MNRQEKRKYSRNNNSKKWEKALDYEYTDFWYKEKL